jgi:hypothetical protein
MSSSIRIHLNRARNSGAGSAAQIQLAKTFAFTGEMATVQVQAQSACSCCKAPVPLLTSIEPAASERSGVDIESGCAVPVSDNVNASYFSAATTPEPVELSAPVTAEVGRCCLTVDCCPADKTCCGSDGVPIPGEITASCCVAAGCCPEKPVSMSPATLQWWLRGAFGLAVFTIVWNVAEGLVSLVFGVRDESISLSIFGVDSFVEVLSAFTVLWRLRAELFGTSLTQQDSARRLQKVDDTNFIEPC